MASSPGLVKIANNEFRAEDVFLMAEIALDENGHNLVPAAPGGKAAIGLEWAERRVIRELALPFPAGTPVPSAELVEVQFWSSAGREDSWGEIGQTAWQGVWEWLPGTVEHRDQRLQLTIVAADVPEFRKQTGVFKVRWLLPPSDKPYRIRRPLALSDSRWVTGEFCFEASPRPAPGRFSIRADNPWREVSRPSR